MRNTIGKLLYVLILLISTASYAIENLGEVGGSSARTTDPVSEPDGEIESQLNSIFRDHPQVNDVRAEVFPGLITLSGEVTDASSVKIAEKIARNLASNKVIENSVTLSLSLSDRLEPALDNSIDRMQILIGYVPLLVLSLLVVATFWLLARFVSSLDAPFKKLSSNPFLQQLIRTLTSVSIMLVGVLFALEILDAMALVGAVLGTAGVAGLALGLAFRDTVENYIAGLLLSIRQPFAPFDSVLIEGHEGQVVRMTSRATVLMGFDGNHIRIPNAKVFQGTMVNFSRNPKRRFDFSVGISTEVDLVAAQKLAINTLHDLDSILDNPAPSTIVETLGDSNVVVRIYGWVDQRDADFKKVKSQSIRCIKEAFDAAEYEMPEPIYRLRIGNLAKDLVSGDVQDLDEDTRDELAETRQSMAFTADNEINTDTKPDKAIEDHIREERALDGDDLLDIDAPRE